MTDLDRYRHPDCETCNTHGPELTKFGQDRIALHRAYHNLADILLRPFAVFAERFKR